MQRMTPHSRCSHPSPNSSSLSPASPQPPINTSSSRPPSPTTSSPPPRPTTHCYCACCHSTSSWPACPADAYNDFVSSSLLARLLHHLSLQSHDPLSQLNVVELIIKLVQSSVGAVPATLSTAVMTALYDSHGVVVGSSRLSYCCHATDC